MVSFSGFQCIEIWIKLPYVKTVNACGKLLLVKIWKLLKYWTFIQQRKWNILFGSLLDVIGPNKPVENDLGQEEERKTENQHILDKWALPLFADEFKNLKSKEKLEEEKHNRIVIDKESPNETANGKHVNK